MKRFPRIERLPPYVFNWEPGNFPNADSITVYGTILLPNLNLYSIEVTDACGKAILYDSIRLYNQCPLSTPNVVTFNGDDNNDYFLINNLEDYDAVHLTVLNRWGNVIYDNVKYLNDWNGKDMSGKDIEDGVYFYTVVAQSEKFIYDNTKKSQFLLSGFFHVFH